jgi:hypothetical protein
MTPSYEMVIFLPFIEDSIIIFTYLPIKIQTPAKAYGFAGVSSIF